MAFELLPVNRKEFLKLLIPPKMNGVLIVCLLLMGWTATASADWTVRTSNRILGNMTFNPGDDALTDRSEDAQIALENRLILLGSLTDAVQTEIHVLSTLDYTTRRLAGASSAGYDMAIPSSGSAFRHPDLSWEWKDADSDDKAITGITELDRLTLRWNTSRTALTVGRQAMGLSTCFYLTTNDFFQPFAPEAIYREYKTGVDALKFQYYTGPLSEIDLIAVMGYAAGKDLEWDDPDRDESALLARYVFSAGGYEWTLMAGKLPWRWMAAGALQGELAGFGVRAECNVNFPEDGWAAAFGRDGGEDPWDENDPYIQVAGGIDYRFASSLHLFAEYLYRNHGFDAYSEFLTAATRAGLIREAYAGRQYLALAAAYQWHPLVTSQVFGIANLEDASALFSGTLTYSLSDEADMIAGGYLAVGDAPELRNGVPVVPSQYGAASDSIYVEVRFYL